MCKQLLHQVKIRRTLLRLKRVLDLANFKIFLYAIFPLQHLTMSIVEVIPPVSKTSFSSNTITSLSLIIARVSDGSKRIVVLRNRLLVANSGAIGVSELTLGPPGLHDFSGALIFGALQQKETETNSA